jgi:hypothetical protein
MDRCWLQGQLGDALHAVLCAAGYNLRWLLRAMLRLGLTMHSLRSILSMLWATISSGRFRNDSTLGHAAVGRCSLNFAEPTT